MRNYSKRVRKLIREYAGLAYERELAAELGRLAGRMNAWKQGQISPWELNDDVWKYVKGPQREMWKKYTNKNLLDLVVARAIADGFLKREEVPGEVLESIDDLINRSEKAAQRADGADEEGPKDTGACAEYH